MNKIKTIIIDDEELGRKIIREFLEAHPEVDILAECGDAYQALEAVNQHDPELLFLDIQMPEINGFEFLERLEDIPLVIFSTAYDQYAIKAFEINAVDYLLKPFDQERFDKALNRAREALEQPSFEVKKIKNLIQHFQSNKQYRDKLLIKQGRKIKMVSVHDIDWIEAKGDYVNIHTKDKTYLILQTLKHLEKELDPNQFVRIHRSSIINLDAILEIIPWTSGRFKINLKNKGQIFISRSGAERLKKFMI